MDNEQPIIGLYNALLLSNDTINSTKNEEDLFKGICQNILVVESINMVWIGLADTTSQTLTPVAHAGEGAEYVKEISIGIGDDDFGNGPSGLAYKTGKPYWTQDFSHNTHTIPWRQSANKYKWQSSAALPIKKQGKTIGTLNIYSTQTHIFDTNVKLLLEKMVSNINHALDTLESEKARGKAEIELKESYNLLSSIINSLPTRIFWKDKNLTYMGCNSVFANDAGKKSPEEIIGKTDYEMTWKDQAELYNEDDQSVIKANKAKLFFEEPQTTPDGDLIWLRTSKVPLKDSNNETIGIIGIYDDITEQKLIEIELKKKTQQLNAIIENEPACVKLINPQGELINMNPAGISILEADSLDEVKRYPLVNYILPKWRNAFLELHNKVMQGKSATLEFEVKGLKGTKKWLETHAVPMYDEENNVNMLLGLTRDITEQKLSEERILFMANYDPLTQLPNRVNLEEKLQYNISLSERNGLNFALMFLDIDNFKDINDTLGHDTGDKLLIQLSERLQSVLRQEDTLARLGGDEFIILLPNSSAVQAQTVAEKLLYAIHKPLSVEHHKLTVTVSIGISLYPDDGTDKETLYKNADTAMYRSKSNGKNNYSFFTNEMQTLVQRNLALSNALHNAINNSELYLTYQPKISTIDQNLVGAEVLLRWRHPKLGEVSPAEFIPIAESNGLILSIGDWVMRNAVVQLKEWLNQGFSPFTMSINLSAVQFTQVHLSTQIEEILAQTQLPAKYLELELTESVIMNNAKTTISIMEKLHQLGLKMSIDDFGTGYSSLSYLKKFQVHNLKIDQSFVRDITNDPEDQAIIQAIINLAKTLGLSTTAEGVETEEQLKYLQEHGCDIIQGFYYSKPLKAEIFEAQYLKPKK